MAKFIDTSGVLVPRRGLPPHEMPHGLLAVPDWVREAVAREKAKAPHLYTPEAEARFLCDVTLQHYFEAEGYEVLYRMTPDGPDVVAVGFEERLAILRAMPEEEQQHLSKHFTTWLP